MGSYVALARPSKCGLFASKVPFWVGRAVVGNVQLACSHHCALISTRSHCILFLLNGHRNQRQGLRGLSPTQPHGAAAVGHMGWVMLPFWGDFRQCTRTLGPLLGDHLAELVLHGSTSLVALYILPLSPKKPRHNSTWVPGSDPEIAIFQPTHASLKMTISSPAGSHEVAHLRMSVIAAATLCHWLPGP